ncbi:Phage holin family protein [Deinococcus saxicola]
MRQGLESERRSSIQGADLEGLTRQLRYREAVDQRLLRLGVGAIVFILSAGWLAADVTLTLAAGWGELGGRPFRLESSVLVAFLTTSTATVIGLFLVFLRWLYPQTNPREERETERDRG